MYEFFALASIFFFILLGSSGYYSLLHEGRESGQRKKTRPKKVSNKSKSILLFFGIVVLLLGASLLVIFYLSQNVLLFYSGFLAFVMLSAAIYLLAEKPYWWLVALGTAAFLIALQIILKQPFFGSLLIVGGYIGVTTFIMKSKFLPPKIVIVFFTLYALYDLIGVFFIPLQTALAVKAVSDIFPPAIQFGRTLIGNGDVLFALLMTAFARTYYGLAVAIVSAFLFSLPLAFLGIVSRVFPQINIAVPYLVFMTPIFLLMVFLMRKKGYTLR